MSVVATAMPALAIPSTDAPNPMAASTPDMVLCMDSDQMKHAARDENCLPSNPDLAMRPFCSRGRGFSWGPNRCGRLRSAYCAREDDGKRCGMKRR
jgi:hypothetical protein